MMIFVKIGIILVCIFFILLILYGIFSTLLSIIDLFTGL